MQNRNRQTERGLMNDALKTNSNAAGFSLLELLIAMTTAIILLGLGSTLLAGAFKIREKQNSVSDALADTQRAINLMSREIANAGFNLNTNGIVAGDSNATSIRIRSNLNKYDTSASSASRAGVIDPSEDVKYFINVAANTDYLVRYDAFATGRQSTVLANRMDSLRIHYFAQQVTYATSGCDISNPTSAEVTPDLARYIVISACVQLPASGPANSPGYSPAQNVLLVSDVTLRNAGLTNY